MGCSAPSKDFARKILRGYVANDWPGSVDLSLKALRSGALNAQALRVMGEGSIGKMSWLIFPWETRPVALAIRFSEYSASLVLHLAGRARPPRLSVSRWRAGGKEILLVRVILPQTFKRGSKLNSRLLISQRSGGSIPQSGMEHIGSGRQENKKPRLLFCGRSAHNGCEQPVEPAFSASNDGLPLCSLSLERSGR